MSDTPGTREAEAARLIKAAGQWAVEGSIARARIIPMADVVQWAEDAKAWLAGIPSDPTEP